MKLYDSAFAPNPRRVRVFLAEKGLEIPRVVLDIGAKDHKQSDYAGVNPFQQVPALELDDGTVLTETMAICRYLEELHPEPNLFGHTALERAQIEMWNRRLELIFFAQVAHTFRHAHPAMAELEIPQIPEWSAVNRERLGQTLHLLDRELADRPFITGERFTIADITGYCALLFMKPARIEIPDTCPNVSAWFDRLKQRPGADA
ncbi:glutathione S-transferase family protein [Coralliovum pocilloporae]|uniref:glutathione S-transferase family protein n=1 Tax=Coralliovum pocilloporae TaxID=3066369 RepID=UPI003306CD89